MKFLAILAVATAALAKPATKSSRDIEIDGEVDIATLQCTTPSYICKPDFSGWLVCNVDGYYLDGGNCDPEAWCEYVDGLPYCIS